MPAAIPGPPPFATATVAGLVSAVAQTFGGDKTFTGKIINTNPLGLQSYTTGTLPTPASAYTGYLVYNTTTSKVMFSDGSAWVALDVSSGSFVSKTGDTMTGALTITGAGLVVDSADNTLVVDATNNRVGIGTATPVDRLDVSSGGLAVRGATLASGAGAFVSHATSITTISSVNWTGPAYRDLRLEAQAISLRTGTSSVTERMLVASNGNVTFDTNTLVVDAVNNRVGILSATPSVPLEVAGIIQSTTGGFKFPDNTVQTTQAVAKVGDTMTGNLVITGAGLNVDSADNTLFVNATTNRVGIGTATPSKTLDVNQAVGSDYLVQIQNTDVTGASGIAFFSNGGTERLRVGYGNPSFSSPSAGVNFWHTDGVTDTVIAHAGVEFHRFYSSGSIKFDQADSLVSIDAGNNRVGFGIASPTAGFLVDMTTSLGSNGQILRIRNTNNAGHGSIEFWNHSSATPQGSIGWAGSGVTDGGANVFSIDIPAGLTIRNGTSNLYTFGSNGLFICNPTDNVLYVSSNTSIKQVAINSSNLTGAAGFTHPFIVELGTTGTRSSLIRGGGTIRKGLSFQDSTNNRTWTIDHSTSGNNNRFETWYHNGTTEARILTLTTDGRMGINNVTPTVALDVDGSAQFTGGLTVDTNTLIVDATNNRVGINTTPAAGNALDVVGDIAFSTALKPGGLAGTAGQILRSSGAGVAPTWVDPGAASISIGSTVTSGTAGSILFVNSGPILAQDNANLFWDDTNNRLGVGTATPSVALDVVGAGQFTGNLTVDTNTLIVDATNNRVGIVTTSPSEALHVTGNVRFSGALMPNNLAGTSGQVLTSAGAGTAPTWAAAMAVGGVLTSGTVGSVLFVGSGPTLTQDNANLFWDDTNNRLGIGNATPSEALHVTGNVRFSGALMPNNSAGTSGQYLQSAGAGAAPTWVTPSVITGTGTNGRVAIWSGTSTQTSDANFTYASTTLTLAKAVSINPALLIDKDLSTTLGNPHLWLGGNAHNTSGGIYPIAFGYTATPGTTYAPGEIGFVTTDTSVSSKGDLYFATRDTTTGSTIPSERMRIKSDGSVQISNNQVTAGSGTGITTNYNGDARRGYFKITFTEAAFTAAATSEDKTVCTIPAKARVVSVIADTTTGFTGGGASTATLRLGKTTNGQEYILDHSVFATGTKGLADGDLGTSINRANAVQGGDIPSWTATTDLKIRLTSDVNVADLTAGSITFYITVEFL